MHFLCLNSPLKILQILLLLTLYLIKETMVHWELDLHSYLMHNVTFAIVSLILLYNGVENSAAVKEWSIMVYRVGGARDGGNHHTSALSTGEKITQAPPQGRRCRASVGTGTHIQTEIWHIKLWCWLENIKLFWYCSFLSDGRWSLWKVTLHVKLGGLLSTYQLWPHVHYLSKSFWCAIIFGSSARMCCAGSFIQMNGNYLSNYQPLISKDSFICILLLAPIKWPTVLSGLLCILLLSDKPACVSIKTRSDQHAKTQTKTIKFLGRR